MLLTEAYKKCWVNFEKGASKSVMRPRLQEASQLDLEGWLNTWGCENSRATCGSQLLKRRVACGVREKIKVTFRLRLGMYYERARA